MNQTIHAVLLVGVMSAGTILLRFLPFLLFPSGKKTPAFVTYLGKVLPFAMIGLLVVYCLKDVSVFSGSHGLPELIAMAVVVVLHVWRRNTLLSVSAGTICYMLLVQFVF